MYGEFTISLGPTECRGRPWIQPGLNLVAAWQELLSLLAWSQIEIDASAATRAKRCSQVWIKLISRGPTASGYTELYFGQPAKVRAIPICNTCLGTLSTEMLNALIREEIGFNERFLSITWHGVIHHFPRIPERCVASHDDLLFPPPRPRTFYTWGFARGLPCGRARHPHNSHNDPATVSKRRKLHLVSLCGGIISVENELFFQQRAAQPVTPQWLMTYWEICQAWTVSYQHTEAVSVDPDLPRHWEHSVTHISQIPSLSGCNGAVVCEISSLFH